MSTSMDQFLSAEDAAFRREVRDFIRAHLPPALARATREGEHLSREMVAPWYSALHSKGWTTPNWPKAIGGPGWSPMRRFIFEAELAAADAPPLSVFGIYLVGPTLEAFGSEAQKQRYLPGILSGREMWCQGYSEPNAGSDLASLRTTARRSTDGWIVNGQKAWTSSAHEADFMICLARTNQSVAPQAGLSLFVLDMKAPGVTVRPVVTLDEEHHVNECFLDNVKLPADALIGEVDRGWTYGKYLLGRERTNNAQVHQSKRDFELLMHLAASMPDGAGGVVLDDPVMARRFAEIRTELAALEVSVLRVISDEESGRTPGPQASIVKLEGSCLQQKITGLAMRVLGVEGLSLDRGDANDVVSAQAPGWVRRHLRRRAVTIYAGASEVQRGIIAKTVLGM